MGNLVKGSTSELPEQKPPPKKAVLSNEGAIPLRLAAKPGNKKQDPLKSFYYQRGKTKIECEGSLNEAIRLALVDTVFRWIVRLLIVAASAYSAHAAKQMFGAKSLPLNKPYYDVKK